MMKKTIFLIALAAASLTSRAEMRWVGDADGDGTLTTADVERMTQYVLGKEPRPKDITLLDVNGDKAVTIADVTCLIRLLEHPTEATQIWVPENVTVGGDKGPFD